MTNISKSGLAIELSRLLVFKDADIRLEQYPTDSEVAADVLWFAYMKGDIKEAKIADLGAGTGILGIGALMLGSKSVYFVEKDRNAINLLKQNLAELENHEIIEKDIEDFNEVVDVVIQNPPFGTKNKHLDQMFLIKAFSSANIVYSFHKTATKEYINKVAKKNDFSITDFIDFKFPLKQTHRMHKRKIHRIDVSCLRFEKNHVKSL